MNEERLKWEAWSNLRDLGYNGSYEDFLVLLETLKTKEVKSNELNINTNK